MHAGVYGANASGASRWPTAYLIVAGVLTAAGALLNAGVFFISVFATDDCSPQNPAFRCTGTGILMMMGLPWLGLAAAAGAALAAAAWWHGGQVWWGLPAGALLYAAGLAATWSVMTSS
ncbi:hypothetical protein [Streptomyces camelliae]|uniref:Integral membrane protein n=1 Tax=Streptomyces camelliae TaxID=3004093 RepID=A0ABY7PD44_9ACTN|nr:hypothetical protein [Streptomyces sp. HUAS 2-6]WBO68317.1 hypothetical protein O1G22_38635 [Streptomyces sp. HUAS 2-6]